MKVEYLQKYKNIIVKLLINRILPNLASAKAEGNYEEYKRFKNLADRIIAVCTGKSAQRYLSKNMIAYLLKLKTYIEKGELGNVKKLEKAIINEFSKLETQIEEELKKAA